MKPAVPPRAGADLKEVRFSLADLLAEAAAEHQTGAFGMEKLHRQDVRRIFRSKRPKRRAR